MDKNIYFAFAMTSLAGLATAVGGAMALHPKLPQKQLLPFGLAFAAGIMLYVSVAELLPEAVRLLAGTPTHGWGVALLFLIGVLLMAGLHRCFPDGSVSKPSSLLRTGWLTAVAIAIHNFPEGFATLMTALSNPTMGATLAVAIALHNVPEGMAVAVPVYHATGNKHKAFAMAAGAGLLEPLGALVGYLLLRPFFSDALLGITFALTAGVMVFISLDELLPAAHAHDPGRLAMAGTLAGMGVMALSLMML
jgi:ZIP family zinc transporter